MKLLLVIDMQNDFLTGSLANPEGVKIIPLIEEKVKEYLGSGDDVIFTKDTHDANYLNTSEGKMLPVVHCVKGTKGHEICDELKKYAYKVIEKPTFGALNQFKDYDFSKYEEIGLVGVCTDICVISNALILKAMYPETPIVVYENLCAGTSLENHESSINSMKSCQVIVR